MSVSYYRKFHSIQHSWQRWHYLVETFKMQRAYCYKMDWCFEQLSSIWIYTIGTGNTKYVV